MNQQGQSARTIIMMVADHILIVTDDTGNARLIKQLLEDDFSNVATSTDAQQAVSDFVAHQPRILLLAFNSLQKAEDYYLGLHRQLPLGHACPHRTVSLCSKDSVQRAYELCKKGQFDDYVLFWPMSFDGPRLHMAVHGALRELHRSSAEASRSQQVLELARQVVKLEPRLREFSARSGTCLDVADESLQDIKGNLFAALGLLGEKLAAHSTSSVHASPGPLVREGERRSAGVRELEERFTTVSGAMRSLRDLSDTIEEEFSPQIHAAHELHGIVARSREHILVVEDDVEQHGVLRTILAKVHADVAFAASGAEAFALLQKRSPDLILMNFHLPDMDGGVAIRNIKSVDVYAGIPIIVTTRRLERSVVLDCKAAGAIDFIGKPFEADLVLAKVRHWMPTAALREST